MQVGIVGGGIAGLVSAICFSRLAFVEKVTVAEKQSELQNFKDIGGSYEITRTSWNYLNQIIKNDEIHKKLLEYVQTYKKAQFCTKNGGILKEIKVYGDLSNRKTPPLHYSIRRSQLLSILNEVIKDEKKVTIIYSKKFSHYTKNNDQSIIAHFKNDFSLNCHLLIGADGIHSKVLKGISEKSESKYQRVTAYWGWCSQADFFPTNFACVYHHYGKYLGCGVSRDGDATWAAFVRSDIFTPLPSPGDVKRQLIESFSDWDPKIRNIIENTKAERIVNVGIFDRDPLEKWAKGRVIVIGDAAHAMTPFLGQGANMSIADGCVLAYCISQSFDRYLRFEKGSTIGYLDKGENFKRVIEIGLEDFEERRIKRANWKVRRARLMANILLSSSVLLHYSYEILIFFVPTFAMREIVAGYDVGNELHYCNPSFLSFLYQIDSLILISVLFLLIYLFAQFVL